MCRKRLSSPRCRSDLIDSACAVIVPGQKCIKKSGSSSQSSGTSGIVVIYSLIMLPLVPEDSFLLLVFFT